MTNIVNMPNTSAPFDPNTYMMKLQGKDYLPVAARIAWINAEFGHEFSISSELVEHNSYPGKNPRNIKEEITIREALFKVRVTFPNGKFKEAWGSETSVDFKDYLEKAETKAIGRALGFAGYGTMFAPEFDESATITRAQSRSQANEENTYENTRAVDTAQDLSEIRSRVSERKSKQGGEGQSSTETQTMTSSGTHQSSNSQQHEQLVQQLLLEIKKSKGKDPLEKQVEDLIAEANQRGQVKRASKLSEDDLRVLVQSVQALVSTHS